MTVYTWSSEYRNPTDERKEQEKTKTSVIGVCLVCWGVIGLLVIVGFVANLLGLF